MKVQELLGDRVGRDIFFYSITLDPENDTPEVLRAYASDLGSKPGWLFLTGSHADIDLIRHKLGFYDPDPRVDADKTQHASLLRYGNEALDRWGCCPGGGDPREIAKTILWMDWPR